MVSEKRSYFFIPKNSDFYVPLLFFFFLKSLIKVLAICIKKSNFASGK